MRQRVFEFQNAVTRRLAASGFALLIGFGSAFAQSGDLRTQDQSGKPAAANPAAPADAARDSQRKTDEFVEASQAINGPAGNPECVWLGRRVVVLMWRDDLDTAFRHLDLYDRFGCPGGHVQATFRCLVRFGAIDPKATDPKAPESLSGRVHACWINPGAQPQAATAAQSTAPSTAGTAAASPVAAPAAASTPAAAAPAASAK
ncbi:beta-1-3, beta-1-6-glucan biosynthesis protein [uncultured Bradyrhizobium sp.]|uniref:beta-1-3, beta-1-6-glucan biosynthesis protein n=1 Tax=uncultured Bradyrhizobium sp. TaxID=199684 RepID=UPI0035CB9BCD